jgi:hypothetical protein
MPFPDVGLPAGENCGSCYFSRYTADNVFSCCYNAPVTNGYSKYPPVNPDFGWCGQWSQTAGKTSIVLQTTATLVRNSTAATLTDTTGLISGKYYAISGTSIPAGTLFSYTGTAAIQLSAPATNNGTVSVTISDSY